MSLLAWIGLQLTGSASDVVIWSAIALAGLVFAVGHIPSYTAAGCRRTPLMLVATISLNLWASLLFGWLFWRYGLASAILAHALFHVCWLPFDRHFVGQTTGQTV
jgi:membrane protease YdiL (CAAX protease family)